MSMMIVIRLFLFFSLNCGLALGGCSMDVNYDLYSVLQPVLLRKYGDEYSLALPKVKHKHGVVELVQNEELVLACPGKHNYLKETYLDAVHGKCVSNTQLKLGNERNLVDIHYAKCAFPSTADIHGTGKYCSRSGKIYEIGFKAEGWQPLMTVCHNPKEANTLYSKHIIYGASLKGAKHNTKRPEFKEGDLEELYNEFHPKDFYPKRKQSYMFKSIFGQRKSMYMNNKSKYLKRGHLAPSADFIFGSWQYATYYYINAALQWRNINTGNWLTVEKVVRKVAIKMQRHLIVIIGTHNILELVNDNGIAKKLYLTNEKHSIPVPAYFWKIVYDPKSKHAIAFLTSNNPYLKTGTSRLLFCKDICVEETWNAFGSLNFMNVSRGFTVCCEYDELRMEIPHVPFIEVKHILRGPF